MWNLKKQVLNNVDIDLVVATEWMENLAKTSPITKNQKYIHKIPFGIDHKKFRSITNEEARKYYKIPKDHVVLFLRAQNEFKGTPYVVEALKELKTTEKITILTCDTKNLLDEIKDKYNVIDLGNIKDKEMIKAMNACDIFLMPSIGESFGLMAIEAMACSKPVIVFNNSALPSVTHAPKCGYLVKNRDSHDLMKSIKKLVESKEERKKRGDLGYQYILKEYTNDEYNKKIKEMYLKIYNRNQVQPKLKITGDKYNLEQLKYILNSFTVMLFGISSKYAKSLLFKKISTKKDNNYKVKYDDILVQELIYEYCQKLDDALTEQKILYNGKRLKIEKAIFLLRNNPKDFLKRVIKRVKRR